jgi:ABC-2 type transport system permease protein
MNRILVLGTKELRLTFRSKMAVFWIFFFPTMFAVFFGVVMSGDGGPKSPIEIAVVDDAHTAGSSALLEKLRASDAVKPFEKDDQGALTLDRARDRVRQGKSTAFLLIPEGYGASSAAFWKVDKPLDLGVDPSRKAEAGLLEGVLMQAVFADLGSQFTDPKKALASARESMESVDAAKGMDETTRLLLKGLLGSVEKFAEKADEKTMANSPFSPNDRLRKVDVLPNTDGKPRSPFDMTFPSSITWAMYGCILTFAISIVAERTTGTMTRLRMSPLTSMEIVAGKGIACFTASVIVAVALIVLAKIGFGIRIGSVTNLILAIFSAAYCYTGLMMALASFGRTEKDVSGAAAGVFMPLSMIGGGMIPRAFMPTWMQSVSVISPIRWNIESVEGAIWRNYSLAEMFVPCAVLIVVGTVGLAIGAFTLSRMKD